MKKLLLLVAITITSSMAHSNIYDYVSTSSSMNIFITNQTMVGDINLFENALESEESNKIEPLKTEAPSFWMV